MAEVVISEGTVADLGDVMVVMADAFAPEYGEAWNEAQCAGMLAMPGTSLLLARDASETVAAFAIIRVVAQECELLMLAVARNSRREGIGATLTQFAMQTAAASGCEQMFLEVRDGNDAVALYSSLGFKGIGRRRSYYKGSNSNRFDALTFARPLRTVD